MRQLGTLPDPQQAERFTDFLLTQGIEASTDTSDEIWVIWIRDEDQLEAARAHFGEFLEQPGHARYMTVTTEAQRLRTEAEERKSLQRRRTIELRQQWRRPRFQRTPLVTALMIVSVVVLLNTSAYPNWSSSPVGRQLLFRSNRVTQDAATKPSVWDDIQRGEVWRLASPMLLHANIVHLLMNLYGLAVFGSQIERRQGTLLFAVLVLCVAIPSNIAQAVITGPRFGGLSGVVFGIVGYVWMMQRKRPDLHLVMDRNTFIFLVVYMLVGFTNMIGPLANWAHAGGFLSGLALAAIVAEWDPLRPKSP